jgi:uncharacterized membrane protein
MAALYTWLKFIHVLTVGAFLFSHGVTGGVSFLLRGPVTGMTRPLLRASQITGQAAYPLILLVVITGIWMTFLANFGHQVWPWAALGILILAVGLMGYVARPYYLARDAAKGADDSPVAARLATAMPQLAAAVGVVALVLIFALMVFKPF